MADHVSHELSKTMGARIRRLRDAQGMKQIELAKAVEVNQGYLSELESGKKNYEISVDKVRRIADVLGTNIEYLLGRTDDARPPQGVWSDYPGEWRPLLARITRLRPEPADVTLLTHVVDSLLERQEANQASGTTGAEAG